ncbi:hypothetical protein BJ165DRAFT_736028 [Panaeolus papilionaceus]|nr:hypothetical protein BJ165DRAFT_736028 [Panaeolus papilionaceus]
MNVLWVLWMSEAILVSIYRTEKNDFRLYYCGSGHGTRCCQHMVAIQAFAFMLLIIGFLYVFAFCLYALGSRNWGEESADASMRSWCSSAFEPSHPSRQIIVVQAPETKTRRAPGVFDLPPPIFTDCRCGWHTIHPTDLTTSDSQNSKMSV